MKSYIIGIAGQKNSGKDTLVSMINYIFSAGITRANYSDWITKRITYDNKYQNRIVHFADSCKDALSIIFSIPRVLFDDRKYKDDLWYCFTSGNFVEDNIVNRVNDTHINITIDMLKNNSLSDIIKNNIGKFIYIKIRTLMQYFGTDVCRNYICDYIWIRSTINKAVDIACIKRICIIPDVRFENECNAIRNNVNDLYGCVIKITRNKEETITHSSENINFSTEFTIYNDESLMSLFYKALNIVESIKKYK